MTSKGSNTMPPSSSKWGSHNELETQLSLPSNSLWLVHLRKDCQIRGAWFLAEDRAIRNRSHSCKGSLLRTMKPKRSSIKLESMPTLQLLTKKVTTSKDTQTLTWMPLTRTTTMIIFRLMRISCVSSFKLLNKIVFLKWISFKKNSKDSKTKRKIP